MTQDDVHQVLPTTALLKAFIHRCWQHRNIWSFWCVPSTNANVYLSLRSFSSAQALSKSLDPNDSWSELGSWQRISLNNINWFEWAFKLQASAREIRVLKLEPLHHDHDGCNLLPVILDVRSYFQEKLLDCSDCVKYYSWRLPTTLASCLSH